MKDGFDPRKYGEHKRRISKLGVLDRSIPSCSHSVNRGGRIERCSMALDEKGDCPNLDAHLS